MSLLFVRSSVIVAPATFNFYISTTGTGTAAGGGTAGDPWPISMLKNATAQARYAGKTVGLMDGTYYVAALASAITDSDEILLDVASGSVAANTVIAAVNTRMAIIDGTDGSGNRVNFYFANGCGLIGQSYLTSGNGYVTLRGLVIRNGYRYLAHFRYSGGPQDSGRKSGVIIEDCDIHTLDNSGAVAGDNIAGVMIYTADGAIVRRCKIYGIRGNSSSEANGYDIQTWSCNNSVFEFNTLKDAKDGIYVKNTAQTGCTIRGNHIDLSEYDGGGTTHALVGFGFSTAGVQHVAAYNNILKARNAFRVFDLNTPLQGPSQFYNNTCVATGTDFVVCGAQLYGEFGQAYKIDAFNNIFINSGSGVDEGTYTFSGDNTGTVDYNFYSTNLKLGVDANGATGGYYPTVSYSSIAAIRAATAYDDNSPAAGNPLIVATGTDADYYKLQGGSPCVNAGKSNGLSGGTTCDIGAWGNGATTIGCGF